MLEEEDGTVAEDAHQLMEQLGALLDMLPPPLARPRPRRPVPPPPQAARHPPAPARGAAPHSKPGLVCLLPPLSFSPRPPRGAAAQADAIARAVSDNLELGSDGAAQRPQAPRQRPAGDCEHNRPEQRAEEGR